MLQTELSVDAALMLPDDFDVALARSEVLSHRLFLACLSASGIGQLLWLLNRY